MSSRNPPVRQRDKVFISYSHTDREFAERLANALHEAGEEVWWDKWEITAGDSLIKRIFTEGLAEAKAFVVVLSPQSVNSKWVREELDVATVQRIEGVTRVIPVLKEPTEIPTSLRSLMWVDMQNDFDAGVIRILNALHGVTAKPPRPSKSVHANLSANVAGFSRAASAVGVFILNSTDTDSGLRAAFSGDELTKGVELDAQTINDAVDELEEAGLVKTIKTLGTGEFDFYQVEPTYVLFREFAEFLPYDPDDDVRVIAAAVAASGRADGPSLAGTTQLPPGRINQAVAFLGDYGLADIVKWMGTSPFSFGEVHATRRTRQFVERQQ